MKFQNEKKKLKKFLKMSGAYYYGRTRPRIQRRRRKPTRRGGYGRRPHWRPGFYRTTGYYGRFSGFKAEPKFHDIAIDDGVVVASGQVQAAMLTIAQGDTESQRDGRAINVVSIDTKILVQLPTTSVPTETRDVVRFLLILDKQCNGALPSWLDIFESGDFQTHMNLANTKRFRILASRTYTLNAQCGAWDGTGDWFGEVEISDEIFIKKNIGIMYDNSATSGVITTIRSNNIVMCTISQSGYAGLYTNTRFRYKDA